MFTDGQLQTDQAQVANVLSSYFESTSSSNNYKPEFLQTKEEMKKQLNFEEANTASYNDPFSMTVFEEALKNLKNSSPGVDNIPYELISQLPPTRLQYWSYLTKSDKKGYILINDERPL